MFQQACSLLLLSARLAPRLSPLLLHHPAADDPYYDEDEDYYLNDVLYGYPYYDSDDDYADYDATLGAFEFGLLDAMYHSLTAGQDFDYDAMLDRGLDGGDEDAWMTDDE